MPGGSLLLFDRKVLRYFRKDGHNWRKKKDGKTVKEAHEKLKVRLQKRSNAFIWSLGIYIWSCRTHSFSYHKKKKRTRTFCYTTLTWLPGYIIILVCIFYVLPPSLVSLILYFSYVPK
jgi:hypothetical protein